MSYVSKRSVKALPGRVLDVDYHVRLDRNLAPTYETLGRGEGAGGLYQREGVHTANHHWSILDLHCGKDRETLPV